VSDLQHERQRNARVVAAMRFADPSSLTTVGLPQRQLTVDDLAGVWRQAVREASDDAAWNLYVHVPYCKSLCTFCNYKRLRVSSRDALDAYVRFLVEEATRLGPALAGTEFGSLYIGGGTPSVLSADQLETLLGGLHRAFRFRRNAHRTFEYDPMVMTADRADVLARFGFRRFSFGIQTMDVDVNRLHGRGPQDRRHVSRQFELFDARPAREINVDFLLGLAGTTPERIAAEVDDVLDAHAPSGVSAYFLTPTAAYVDEHFGGDTARYESFLAAFESRAPGLFADVARRRGYAMEHGKHAIRLRKGARATLRDAGRRLRASWRDVPAREIAAALRGIRRADLAWVARGYPWHELMPFYCDVPSVVHRPLYLLGLGDSARSRVFGRLLYRAAWDEGDDRPDAARYVGHTQSRDDEIWSYVSHTLRDADVLDRGRFRRTFGADVCDACGPAVDKLRRLGVASVTPRSLVLRPQARRERLRDLLFFAPERLRDARDP